MSCWKAISWKTSITLLLRHNKRLNCQNNWAHTWGPIKEKFLFHLIVYFSFPQVLKSLKWFQCQLFKQSFSKQWHTFAFPFQPAFQLHPFFCHDRSSSSHALLLW
jgi:hypothetical protein